MYLCKKPLRLTGIHKHAHDCTVLVLLLSLLSCVLSLWCPSEGPFWSSAHEYPRHNGALLTLPNINTSDCCSASHLCNPQGSTSGACLRRRIRESLPHQPSLKGQVQLQPLHWEENSAQWPLQSLSVHTWKRGARDVHGCAVPREGDSRARSHSHGTQRETGTQSQYSKRNVQP